MQQLCNSRSDRQNARPLRRSDHGSSCDAVCALRPTTEGCGHPYFAQRSACARDAVPFGTALWHGSRSCTCSTHNPPNKGEPSGNDPSSIMLPAAFSISVPSVHTIVERFPLFLM
mmetsp:Transcript_4355/g.9994  ORF Transcript_4355/g.9994 Transcript_4355/m.9994 type:complete len:115 (-) Transcript_4355:562-906(-)